MRHRVRAAVLMAADSSTFALRELRAAGNVPAVWSEWLALPELPMKSRPELARAYLSVGALDSAIAVFERYVAARHLHRSELDAFQLGPALLTLAALYEQQGRSALAARSSTRLAELWRDADHELQPRLRLGH